MTMPNQLHLSIITPVFRTASYVDEFYDRITKAASKITDSYEIIFVNDASPDDALDKIMALHKADPHVGIVDLARNFGQHKVIFAGLAAAKGDYVFVLDADLEEKPEWLTLYYDALQSDGADVVYGYQKSRKGGIVEKITGYLSFYIVNRIFGVPNRKNVVTATLMNKQFVENLLQYPEDSIIFSVSCYLTGFKHVALVVQKQHRGTSGYSLSKRFAHFMDYAVAVTNKPLIWPGYIGAALLVTGIILLFYTFLGLNVSHFYDKLLIATVLMVGGMIMMALGTVGLYLANTLANARRRPRTIIKKYYAPHSSNL